MHEALDSIPRTRHKQTNKQKKTRGQVLVAHSSMGGGRSGGSQFKASSGKKAETFSKNTEHKKGQAEWLKWLNTCLVSVRFSVQTPVLLPPKKGCVVGRQHG
jgi:hypothetical protein